MTAEWDTVAILGVGLIGGSIGLGLLERGLARRVVGIGRRPASLRAARRRGAATETTTDVARGVAEASLVIVCTPVDHVAEHVAQIRRHCLPEALVTDVASTKATIVAAIAADDAVTDPERRGLFVGSHPLAGSEKTGVRFAEPDLFAGRAVVVTPTVRTPAAVVRKVTRFWKSLGARVSTMSAESHDEAVAAISHLPHLVASALAAATPRDQLKLVGGGWRDTTRVAAGRRRIMAADFWRQSATPGAVSGPFHHRAGGIPPALVEGDEAELRRLLEAGKEIRDAVGN